MTDDLSKTGPSVQTPFSTLFYRLKMVDNDGTVEISKIQAVEFDKSKRHFSVFPNPTSGDLTIKTSDYKGSVLVELYNVNGQKVGNEQRQVIDNQGIIKLSTANLPNGIYSLRLTNNGFSEHKMVEIQK